MTTTSTQPDYDAIIIGGGLVGHSLALALSQCSLKIALIEEKSSSLQKTAIPDQRPLSLAKRSQEWLAKIGVWNDLAEKATPIREVHVSDRGHFGRCRLQTQSLGIDAFGYTIPALELAAALMAKTATDPNITIHCPAKFTAFHRKEPTSEILLKLPEGEKTLTARLIFGADGVHSPIRACLGITSEFYDYQEHAIVANIDTDQLNSGIAYERFTQEGPLALLPRGQAGYGLVWTTPSDQRETRLALDDQQFLSAVTAIIGDRIGNIRHIGVRSTYPLQRLQAKTQVSYPVVLLGNANLTMHPIAAQGYNVALRDVALLVAFIQRAIRQNRLWYDRDLITRWQDLRAPDQQRMLRYTHHLAKIFRSRFLPVVLGRQLGLAALEYSPLFNRLLARYGAGLS